MHWFSVLFAVKHFRYAHATVLGHLRGAAHLVESCDGSLDEVVGVGASFGLGEHVGDTYALKHCTHSATGLYTGTFAGGLQEDARAAELGAPLVGDGAFVYGHADEVLLGGLYAFGDGSLNFVRFAEAPADDAVFVADYYDCSEAERTTTFGHFGDTVDGNEAVRQFEIIRGFYSIISRELSKAQGDRFEEDIA